MRSEVDGTSTPRDVISVIYKPRRGLPDDLPCLRQKPVNVSCPFRKRLRKYFLHCHLTPELATVYCDLIHVTARNVINDVLRPSGGSPFKPVSRTTHMSQFKISATQAIRV